MDGRLSDASQHGGAACGVSDLRPGGAAAVPGDKLGALLSDCRGGVLLGFQ